jgi:hypothetical protein
MTAILDAALSYARRGWPVLALRGKIPLAESSGAHDATTDENKLRKLLANADLNIGISLPSLFVLDIDAYKPEGQSWLAAHRDRLRGITLTCRTGRGGWHLYFIRPAEVDLKGALAKGVDLRRGSGHYVVAPPSIHPETGQAYKWVQQWPKEPSRMPLWLFAMCRRERVVHAPQRAPARQQTERDTVLSRAYHYIERADPAVSGSGGHNHTFSLCLRLATNFPELSIDELWPVLCSWNIACVPPWSESELRHKLNDACRVVRGRAA